MEHEKMVLWALSVTMCGIMILGIIGNTLCLVIWYYGERCSKVACSTYFKYIAALNLFNIVANGPSKLLQQYNIYIADYNIVLCKVYIYVEPFGFILPVWMLITLSFERMLSICFPFKFRLDGARKRAHVAFVILSLSLFGVVCRDLFQRELQYHMSYDNVTSQYCYYDEETEDDYKLIRKLGIAGFFCVFPFVLINICNISILVKMCWQNATQQINSQHDKISIFTKFCIAIGVLHCISTLPTTVFNADVIQLDLHLDDSEKMFLRDFSSVCAFLSNSLDFVIYYSIGGAFQMDLKELLW